MVSSSKKKRGKQRKAAKSQSEDINLSIIHDSDKRTLIEKTQHEKCAKLVQRGEDIATNAIKDLMGTELCCPGTNSIVERIKGIQRRELGAPLSSPNDDGTYTFVNISIEQSGVLTTVLNFLKRCVDETFHQVMNSVAGKGDLVSPATWIGVLSRAEELEPSCSLQIAQSIGPLVNSMCSDTKRIFFKSNRHWKEGIEIFIGLIGNMLSNSINGADKEVVKTLLKYEGLLTSIVQWGFWKDHRPDIVKALGMEECTVITEMGITVVGLFVNDAYRRRDTAIGLTVECKKLMWSIGTTPIVSREYDQVCIASYNEGFICRTKEAEGFKMRHDLLLLQVLVTDIDCVDKGVITAMIDFGSRFTSDYNSSAIVAGLSSYCLKQSDTRVAFAVHAGLVEMCLGFIDRYGIDFFNEGENSFCRCLENIFTTINTVSLHQKTAKAIRSKKIEIQGALARLERKSKVERAVAGRTNDMKKHLRMYWLRCGVI